MFIMMEIDGFYLIKTFQKHFEILKVQILRRQEFTLQNAPNN